MEKLIPNLHILGFQKAGTSALSHFLSQHKDICSVAGKEAHVYDDPALYSCADKQQFILSKYQSRLRHYDGEKYILDSTPITILHPFFVRECVESNPDAKFIIALRDPVERAISHYKMTRSRNLEPCGILKAFLLEPWRMRGFDKYLPVAPFEHPYRDYSYLRRGLYNKQISYLNTLVDTRQLLLIHQEEMIQNHDKTLAAIFEFLNLTSIDVKPERVFESQFPEERMQGETLARWYAKIYFKLNA